MSPRKQQYDYEVRPSPIHGKGLFAARAFRRGERIGEYKGKILKRSEVIGNRKRDCTYLVGLKGGHRYIDGANELRYANHADGSGDRWPNARLRELDNKRVFLYATRAIHKGDEILFNYGYNAARQACDITS